MMSEKNQDLTINGPKSEAILSKATVKVRVPVAGTANMEMQEIEMPLSNFFAIAQSLYDIDTERIKRMLSEAGEEVSKKKPTHDEILEVIKAMILNALATQKAEILKAVEGLQRYKPLDHAMTEDSEVGFYFSTEHVFRLLQAIEKGGEVKKREYKEMTVLKHLADCWETVLEQRESTLREQIAKEIEDSEIDFDGMKATTAETIKKHYATFARGK